MTATSCTSGSTSRSVSPDCKDRDRAKLQGRTPQGGAISNVRIAAIAERLIAAQDAAAQLDPITRTDSAFDVAEAYAVLGLIEQRRRALGWHAVGRKIGFTNRTIWPRYGVFQPMWAHVWRHTVHELGSGRGMLPLAGLVQPRIEPEVVFKLRAAPALDRASSPGNEADARRILASVEWMAPGFEIVQSHFPDWRFEAADCTADCGLHGCLAVGPALPVTAENADRLADLLARFTLTLRKAEDTVDVGGGANVLDSPAMALAHLVRLLATQRQFPPLSPGEIVTTGTLTDAWPVAAGETWSSDYDGLGLSGLTVTFQ